MIALFVALHLISANDSRWPDPYMGFSFRTFAQKYAEGDPAAPTVIQRHQKYFQLGLPFYLRDLKWGSAERLKLVAVPELLFSDVVFMFNGGLGIEQDMPFGGYWSYPKSFFWGIATGVHLGFLLDKKDYRRSDGGITEKRLGYSDQVSYAAFLKAYFGPTFPINQSADLKFRIGTDLYFGKLGWFMLRTSISDMLGSLIGFQIQLDFK